jgi:RNA methyltransferase, TrmH family
MLTKAKIKFIKSLQIKKYRKQEQSFIVQGAKSVEELLNSDFETLFVTATPGYLQHFPTLKVEVIEASKKELSGLGEFQSNESVLAVAKMKPNTPIKLTSNGYALILDDIRDPGNLGTIIRTADWFGIHDIIASHETADFYNPKVINASMGSFTRTSIFYADLEKELSNHRGRVYGAYLNGKDVHKEKFEGGGMVLIGNEARGISENLRPFVTDKITIPRYGGAESLNAAIATAVICDNIRRNHSTTG